MAAIDTYTLIQGIIILWLSILTYLNIYFNPLVKNNPINKSNLSVRNKKIIFWLYTLILLGIVFYIAYNIDVGIYNDLNHLLVIIFITFNFILNILIYAGRFKFTKREFSKTWIFAVVVFFFFLLPTILVEGSFYYPPTDRRPDWKTYSDNFKHDNTSYNVSIHVENMISTMHGFFIDSPLVLEVYGGDIRFNNMEVPKNSTIELMINTTPYPYDKTNITEIKNFYTLDTQLTDKFGLNPSE